MSLLDSLVNISITAQTKVPTVQGFGTPLLLAYHTRYSDLLRSYLDLASLLTDGFTVNDQVYKMASKIFAQNPHPPSFYVGRRQLPFTQIVELTLCNTGSLGYVYSYTIVTDDGLQYPVSLASTGSPTADATLLSVTGSPVTYDHTTSHAFTATGYPYLRNGQPVTLGGTPPTGFSLATTYYMVNVTATTFQLSATKGGSVVTATTDNGTSVTLSLAFAHCTVTNPSAGVIRFTSTAGHMIDITGLPTPAKSGALGTITVKTTTADPGIVADLAAIEAVDSTSWYGVLIDSNGKAEIEALAAHIETQTKIFGYTTSDSDCVDNAVSTDVMSQLQALGYTRTIGLYLANETESYGACAWVGNRLSTQPGAANWAYCALVGVAYDSTLGGYVTVVTSVNGGVSKNGNVYVPLAGLGSTLFGLTPSGEFIDIPIAIDWMKVNMQARILIRLANASAAGSKIPYTDDGAAQIRQDVDAQLAAAQTPTNPILVPGTVVVKVPKVATISPVQKGQRIFGPITFSGQLQGSINQLTVNGTVTL
jgi:hypothetical protein